MRLSAYSPNRISISGSLPSPVRASSQLNRRLWSRIRARISPASSITHLDHSFDPRITLRRLRDRRWRTTDAHWLICLLVWLFALTINVKFLWWQKLAFGTFYSSLLLMPVTSQFFLPFTPIGTWLVLFFSCGSIPSSWRPGIWVRVLPSLENIFYGVNISNLLSAHKYVALDILAWIPYGLTHFGAPAVCSLLLFIFGPPGYAPMFAKTFGYMNLCGVAIQLLFPCAPPWYENKFGLAPADYSMAGSPAGLARVDALTGLDMYTTSFTASPLVFGAFPSLHAGSATTEVLFMSVVFPALVPAFAMYTGWLCWSTMYLSHHYAVDLVGGALLAGICFYVTKVHWLPRVQGGKSMRWDYEYIERGDHLESPTKAAFELLNQDDDEDDGGDMPEMTESGDQEKSFEEELERRESEHRARVKHWRQGSRTSSFESANGGRPASSPINEEDRQYESDAETLAGSDRMV